jgi:hypothetical protein
MIFHKPARRVWMKNQFKFTGIKSQAPCSKRLFGDLTTASVLGKKERLLKQK